MTSTTTKKTGRIRVLIVDDHDLLREGLKRVVDDEPDIEVVGEAENSLQALAVLRKEGIDVALVDINLPGTNGIDLLKAVKREWPSLPVVMLTAAPEEHYAVWAIKSGASGYLSKDHAVEQLAPAIRKVVTGTKYITPSVAERLANQIDALQPSTSNLLSEREIEVLKQIAQGKSTSQIAEALSLSAKTIGTYRTRIQQKTGLRSNAELARFAVERKFLT